MDNVKMMNVMFCFLSLIYVQASDFSDDCDFPHVPTSDILNAPREKYLEPPLHKRGDEWINRDSPANNAAWKANTVLAEFPVMFSDTVTNNVGVETPQVVLLEDINPSSCCPITVAQITAIVRMVAYGACIYPTISEFLKTNNSYQKLLFGAAVGYETLEVLFCAGNVFLNQKNFNWNHLSIVSSLATFITFSIEEGIFRGNAIVNEVPDVALCIGVSCFVVSFLSLLCAYCC